MQVGLYVYLSKSGLTRTPTSPVPRLDTDLDVVVHVAWLSSQRFQLLCLLVSCGYDVIVKEMLVWARQLFREKTVSSYT